jgi:hypothetical protein
MHPRVQALAILQYKHMNADTSACIVRLQARHALTVTTSAKAL